MRYIIILILFIEALQAQQPYNYRFENGEIQAFGQLVYELDDSYLGIGRGFDTIDYRRGVYATEFDKQTGEILSTSKYNRQGKEYYFNRGNTVIDISGVPYFIFHGSDTILLATYSDIDKEIVIKKKIASSTPSVSLFIYDFHFIDGIFYILTEHSLGEKNGLIFTYDLENDILEEIYFHDPEGILSTPRMQLLENGNYLVTYTRFVSNGAFQHFIEIDPNGNTLWKHMHDGFAEISAQTFIPIDSFNYLIGGYKGRDVPNSADGEGIPFLMKFDYKSKEVVAVSDFEIPDEEWYTWNGPVEEITPSHDGSSLLCVAQLYDFPMDGESLFSSGMVAKVDEDLNTIWRRTYRYIDQEYKRHWIEDIIATSDGNYLCYGTSQDAYFPPPDIPLLSWAFKIDEDGKIVGDTSTSTIDWEHEEYTEEISIFPNPASEMIYINQDDIEQVTYRVYDVSGKLDDEFDISSKNSSVMKDIGAWSSGMKFIQIIKDGKLIGTNKFVKL
jgi:hypothetical protein